MTKPWSGIMARLQSGIADRRAATRAWTELQLAIERGEASPDWDVELGLDAAEAGLVLQGASLADIAEWRRAGKPACEACGRGEELGWLFYRRRHDGSAGLIHLDSPRPERGTSLPYEGDPPHRIPITPQDLLLQTTIPDYTLLDLANVGGLHEDATWDELRQAIVPGLRGAVQQGLVAVGPRNAFGKLEPLALEDAEALLEAVVRSRNQALATDRVADVRVEATPAGDFVLQVHPGFAPRVEEEPPGPRDPLPVDVLLCMTEEIDRHRPWLPMESLLAAGGGEGGATVEQLRDFVAGSLEPPLAQGLIRPAELRWPPRDPPLERLSVSGALQLALAHATRGLDWRRDLNELVFVPTPLGNTARRLAALPGRQQWTGSLAPAAPPAGRLRPDLALLRRIVALAGPTLDELGAHREPVKASPYADAEQDRASVRDLLAAGLAGLSWLQKPPRSQRAYHADLVRDRRLHGLDVDESMAVVDERWGDHGSARTPPIRLIPTPYGVSVAAHGQRPWARARR